MSVYTNDKGERFVSQRAGCGKAARPDSVRGVLSNGCVYSTQKNILLSAHREENIDTEKNFTSLFTAINVLAEKYDTEVRLRDNRS